MVPVQPTPVDLWATEPTLAMIAREGARSLLVLNRVVARALITAEIAEAVAKLGHPLAEASFGSRVAYAACIGEGSTVLETAPGGPAPRRSRRSPAKWPKHAAG